MKTWRLRDALLLCAAVLAVACAVFLPPCLSRLADRQLTQAQYAVQVESLDVSLVYRTSTAQRLDLLARSEEEDVLVFSDGQPAQDELSAEQAAALCREELNRLFELGVLPCEIPTLVFRSSYQMLCDRYDRQQSVSLWLLTGALDFDSDLVYTCTLTLDAQTGLIYSLSLRLVGTPEFSLEDAAQAWGSYLELGAPTIQEQYKEPASAGETDIVSYIRPAFQVLTAVYETDDGTISCYFQLVQDPDPKLPSSTIIITPFSLSSES